VLVAPAKRHPLGVEMLQQRLGELTRGPERVAELGERDRSAVLAGQRDHAPFDLVEDLGVIVKRPGDASCAACGAQRGQLVGVHIGLQRRLKARLPQSPLEFER
jgi:hypothetical protein